jgi:hypothetical protein
VFTAMNGRFAFVNPIFNVEVVMCGVNFLSSTRSNEQIRLAILRFREKVRPFEAERLPSETKNAWFRMNDHLF